MGKEIGCSFKYNRSRISTPTLKKPFLSSIATDTSSGSNSTRTFISFHFDNEGIIAIYNNNNTSNTYETHSCVTQQKINYIVHATFTPPGLKLLNTTLYIAPVQLQTTTKLPPVGKYFSPQINSKSTHASQCVKSRILNKAVDYILSIATF